MRAISNKYGCLPISPKWTNFDFFQQFLAQNLNSKRVYFIEKFSSPVSRALWDGPFWLKACLWTGQIWADQIFYDHFEFKIHKDCGSALFEKLLQSKFGIVDANLVAAKFFLNLFNFVL